jgi:protein PET117
MSTAAKLTLASTALATVGIVYFVHRQQKTDQAVRRSTIGLALG